MFKAGHFRTQSKTAPLFSLLLWSSSTSHGTRRAATFSQESHAGLVLSMLLVADEVTVLDMLRMSGAGRGGAQGYCQEKVMGEEGGGEDGGREKGLLASLCARSGQEEWKICGLKSGIKS